MEFSAAPDLTGRVAVVTGASSGIGAATARRLARCGAKVALLARRTELVTAVAADCDGLAVPVDVADLAAFRAAAEQVRGELGPVDLVVANAGMLVVDPLLDAAPDRVAELVTTNVTGTAWAARMFAADLRAAAAEGRTADVVFIGSPSGGAWNYPLMGLYGATKAAVNQLAVIMRGELGPAGVRVHNVEPNWTLTGLTESYAAGAVEAGAPMPDPDPAVVPLSADDVAAAVAFAVSAPPGVNINHVSLGPTRLG